MSDHSNTFLFRAILKLSGGESESYVDMHVPMHYTVRDLMDFIRNQLRTFYSSRPVNIHYLFHHDQVEMTEETRLGGVLLPEDVFLSDSIMEYGSSILIETEPLPPSSPLSAGEVEEEKNDSIFNYLLQPSASVQVVDIDEQVRITDLQSIFNTFYRSGDINQINSFVPAVPPRTSLQNSLANLLGGYSMNQLSSDISVLSSFLQLPLYNNQRVYQDVVVGLDKNELDKLRNGTYAELKKDSLDTCSICFEPFNDEDKCRELKCSHLFHLDCVDTWLKEHITCPVCREETGKGIPKL